MFENPSIDKRARRGRAAATNASGRYERLARVPVDDGWGRAEAPTALPTLVRHERPRKAITRNSSPDIPFDRSVNPYRGCEHGCIYCFARPSHAWLGLSPGLDFETNLVARPGIGEALARELSGPAYRADTLALGTITDPYQPVEKSLRVTRGVLEVLHDFNHPVSIVTRGTLVERDTDLLTPMARKGLAHVGISLTTLDARLARVMEPRAPAPARRLAMIRRLTNAGIPVRVMVAPVIPGLTDSEVESLLEAAAESGANGASWIMLRLPREVGPLFRDWLTEHMPDRAGKVMSKLQDMHGGKDYESTWGHRFRGKGSYAELISQRFHLATKRFHLNTGPVRLRNDLFKVPPRPGDQLTLF